MQYVFKYKKKVFRTEKSRNNASFEEEKNTPKNSHERYNIQKHSNGQFYKTFVCLKRFENCIFIMDLYGMCAIVVKTTF